MDEKIEKAIEPLIKMYEKIEMDLLIKIASNFNYNAEFTNSDYWRIKKLEEMGLFNEDVINYLAKQTNKTNKEIKKALNQIGIDTVNIDKLVKSFNEGKLKINPNILKNNYTIKNIILAQYNELSNRFIELSSKIEKSVKDAYLNVVEEAYLKTAMGTHSYQEAIRSALNELSNKGINTLTYQTKDNVGNVVGIRNYDIESAVRREVLTSSRQLNANISKEVADELDSDYLYISEHLECRPQHFEWQGTIISKEDLEKTPVEKYPAYGEVDGICGINCRHYFEPYFGEERGTDLKHFTKEECKNAYDLSQKQRYLERGVRNWKRKSEMYKANDDVEAYALSQNKVLEWERRTQEFTKNNKLKRDFTREYVSNKENAKINKDYADLVNEANLKYNIGVQEENIKRCIKARDIQNYIRNKQKLNIIENKQLKHNIVNDKYSYFYISLEEEQKLINEYAGTGRIIFKGKSNEFNDRESIKLDKIIGKCIVKDETDKVIYSEDTNTFIIHYRKTGTHIVPSRKE